MSDSGKKTPRIEIIHDQCKGCELCVGSCPKKCIKMGNKVNHLGYTYAEFVGVDDCTGCGMCFYACPEPGAIIVYKKTKK